MALLTPPAAGRRRGVAEWIRIGLYRYLGFFFGASVGTLWPGFMWTSGGCRAVWLLVSGMLCLLWATPASAQVAKAPEYSLKAAYLFNFIQFVEWPSNSFTSEVAPIIIGVLGEDPFVGALDQAIKEKKVHGRSFEIRRSKQIGDLRECQVLFVCASEAKRLSEILPLIKKSGLLTVSDIDRFAEQGGVINFTMENNKVRFEVNMNAATAANLKISAQLLRLAKQVWRADETKP
jgi:hypothetical protein